MIFSSAPYALWVAGVSQDRLPFRTYDARLLPDYDAAGALGTPPKAVDILYLIDRICRVCTAWGFRKRDLYLPSSYNPLSQIPDKATLVELSEFIRRLTQGSRQVVNQGETYAVKRNAKLWDTTPELTEGLNYVDDVIKAQAVEPISDSDQIRDTVDDGDAIRALYQDVANLLRFVIRVGVVTSLDEVTEMFTHYGDEDVHSGGYPVLGPYTGRNRPLINHYSDGSEEEVDNFFGEVVSFGWSGSSEYLYRYLTMDSPVYIQISRTGSAHPQSLRGDSGILYSVAKYNTAAKLILLWHINGANATKRFPMCQIAIPYSLTYEGTLGGLRLSSPIDFVSQARALMQLYRQKYPSWYSSREDFSCIIGSAWFDTGDLGPLYGLPSDWKFERK